MSRERKFNEGPGHPFEHNPNVRTPPCGRCVRKHSFAESIDHGHWRSKPCDTYPKGIPSRIEFSETAGSDELSLKVCPGYKRGAPQHKPPSLASPHG